MRGQRICVVDKTHYQYCPDCGKDNPNETWRFLFCSENCRSIYGVLDQFANKKIDAASAMESLDKLTLPPLDMMQSSLRKNIEDIYLQGKVEKENIALDKIENKEKAPAKPKKRPQRKLVNEIEK